MIGDPDGERLEFIKDSLGDLERKIVSRGFVVSADKDLPLPRNELGKLGFLGFTTKKPRSSTHRVI
jgi:hypothetical protein